MVENEIKKFCEMTTLSKSCLVARCHLNDLSTSTIRSQWSLTMNGWKCKHCTNISFLFTSNTKIEKYMEIQVSLTRPEISFSFSYRVMLCALNQFHISLLIKWICYHCFLMLPKVWSFDYELHNLKSSTTTQASMLKLERLFFLPSISLLHFTS